MLRLWIEGAAARITLTIYPKTVWPADHYNVLRACYIQSQLYLEVTLNAKLFRVRDPKGTVGY